MAKNNPLARLLGTDAPGWDGAAFADEVRKRLDAASPDAPRRESEFFIRTHINFTSNFPDRFVAYLNIPELCRPGFWVHPVETAPDPYDQIPPVTLPDGRRVIVLSLNADVTLDTTIHAADVMKFTPEIRALLEKHKPTPPKPAFGG